jgi:hypothetical protein
MPDLRKLTTDSVRLPPGELHEARVNESAIALGQEVTCVIPNFDPLKVCDPMAWNPVITAVGVFYPKQGDRAVISAHRDGPGVIIWWQPSATVPDSAF